MSLPYVRSVIYFLMGRRRRPLFSLFGIFFTIVWLSGCATPARILQRGETLPEMEGVVLLMSHSEYDGVVLQLDQIDGAKKSFTFPSIPSGVQFNAIKLPVGTYQIKKATMGVYFANLSSGPLLKVEARKLNYWGDLYISRSTENGRVIQGSLSTDFEDKQEKMEAYLAERFPDLLKRYPIAVHFPVRAGSK